MLTEIENPNPSYYRDGNLVIAFKNIVTMRTLPNGGLQVWNGSHCDQVPLALEKHKECANAFENWLTGK